MDERFDTLMVTNRAAFELLGEDNAAIYFDNGGESDGSAWLPSAPLTSLDEGVDEVLDAGYGREVRAVFTNLDNICKALPWLAVRIRTTAEMNGNDPESPTYEDIREVLGGGSERVDGREISWMWSGFDNGYSIVVYTFDANPAA